MATRTEVFKWISDHEKTFYLPRQPINPIGVYFSPATRNYFADEFMSAYKGMIYLLLQSHLEFQIVTPRNRSSFAGDILILPDAKCLSADEIAYFEELVKAGKTLMVSGETGAYDATGLALAKNPLHERLGATDGGQTIPANSGKKFIHYADCPGKMYSDIVKDEFNELGSKGEYLNSAFYEKLMSFAGDLTTKFAHKPAVEITASPFVATQIASVDQKPHVFIANFKGLKGEENAVQMPENEVKITFTAERHAKVFALPFLGESYEVAAEWRDGRLSCVIPQIDKGMVVWCE
jgi:hypothetical protein